LLASVLVVCLVLLTVQSRGSGTGRPADLLSFLTTPPQMVLAKLHRGAVTLWREYVDWKSAHRDNVSLRSENERLRLQALRVLETQQENERLRRMLALRERLPLRTLTGEIIGREAGGWVRSITVNRGRGDGLTSQMAVIVPDGLVGRIVRVQPGVSVVQLLNDPASTVGAVVQRTRTAGLVEGEPGGAIRFKFMARDGASITRGDLIVTSGHGNVFPKGLPVGRVVAVEDKGSALFHFAILAPAVDFGRLEEVLVLTEQTPQDLAGAFARES
jgi:rod shape-determining protein MreC